MIKILIWIESEIKKTLISLFSFYFQGSFESLIETLGLSLFSIILVGTSHDFLQIIFFMNGIFIFPVIYQLCKEVKMSVEDHMYSTNTGGDESTSYITDVVCRVTMNRYSIAAFFSVLGIIFAIVYTVSWSSHDLHLPI